MYCTKCGAWNPEESKFCAKCGRPLEEAGQGQRERPRPWAIMALAGALLVLAVACVVVFAMRDRLSRAWEVLAARPTEVVVLPTPSPTQVPVEVTATPTATPMPSPSPTTSQVPSPTLSPAPTVTPTPRARTFRLVYGDCVPHGFSLGSVKGQVFDKAGRVIAGARVRITINGYQWESAANPATTNSAGWYEWTLEVGQKVQFVELIVDGKSVSFTPESFEVKATGSCFQRVDFVEQ